MKSSKSRKGRTATKGQAAAPLKILPALSEKQGECLLFIFNYYARHKHFPTHREITSAMGSTSTTAAMYVEPLIEKGYLVRAGGKKEARNIRITTDGLERLRLMGVTI